MAWWNPTSWFQSSTTPGDYDVKLKNEAQINELINRGIGGLQNRAAPQVNAGPQDQFRTMQLGQANQLQGIASGQQKGAGELAAERQAQQAQAAQQALASMRGAGGAGQLAAARQSASIGSTAAGMGRQAALQDQMQAQGMLGQVLGQGRGQDLSMAGQNAQLAQQQTGMNDQAYLNFLQSLQGQDQLRLQGQLAAMNAAAQQAGQQRQMLGSMLGTAGQVLALPKLLSDERAKKDVAPAGAGIDALLANLRPVAYSYKDEAAHGEGRRAGILAQDLERSPLGRAMVMEEDGVKHVDAGKALSALLAGAARLDERLRKVEERGA